MNTTASQSHNGWVKIAILLLIIPIVILLAWGPFSSPDRDFNPEDANAQFYHGMILFHGRGVPEDKKEGVRWWKKAAEQGHAEAQFILGMTYTTGGDSIPENQAEAKRWLKMAANQGHSNARTMLRLTKKAEARRRLKEARGR